MPSKHSPVERAVLKRITPGKIPTEVTRVIRKIEEAAKKNKLSVAIGGSTAKGTHLKGDHDIDVYVQFPKGKDFADRLESILSKLFKAQRVHGSRDYFIMSKGNWTFEIVPVLKIRSWDEAENVTDMSPLHVEYVRKRLNKKPWLADEIRLTKQFCKAAKVYGAESYIGGFSGHVIDILNIHFGGFRKLLEAASKWKSKAVIDPDKLLEDPIKELNASKTYAPLIIVDPLQRERNAAAALTKSRYEKFKLKAKAYLASPDSSFFKTVPLKRSELEKANPKAKVIEISLKPHAGKKDVVGAKCYKVFQYCMQQLVINRFPLLESKWEFSEEKAILLFAIESRILPKEENVIGPPIHMTVDVEKFKKKHDTTFTHNGKIHALEKRKFRNPMNLLKHLCRQKYVKERVKKMTVITR